MRLCFPSDSKPQALVKPSSRIDAQYLKRGTEPALVCIGEKDADRSCPQASPLELGQDVQIAEEESPIFFLDPQDADVLSIQPKDADVARNKTLIEALPLPLRVPGAIGSDDVVARCPLHQGEDEIRVFRDAWPCR